MNDHDLPLNRLEAFTDGVFAIAVTIVVLEIGIKANEKDHLREAILHEWPAYLAYVTSFLTLGVAWLQHSAIVSSLRAADAKLYRLNIVILLVAAFVPFPTKLMAEFIGDGGAERTAAVFYGLTMLALTAAMTAFGRYAARDHLRVQDQPQANRIASAMRHSPSYILYAVGIGVSVVAPTIGIALYLASALERGARSPTQQALRKRLLGKPERPA
ncbi:MAG TPA: TMEM175 family protein [Gaiellaceae bacterium]